MRFKDSNTHRQESQADELGDRKSPQNRLRAVGLRSKKLYGYPKHRVENPHSEEDSSGRMPAAVDNLQKGEDEKKTQGTIDLGRMDRKAGHGFSLEEFQNLVVIVGGTPLGKLHG